MAGQGLSRWSGNARTHQIFDWDEPAGAVEAQRGGVSGSRLGLDGKADGPGVSSLLMNCILQRPPGPATPGAGDNVAIPQLPKAAQPEGRENTHRAARPASYPPI